MEGCRNVSIRAVGYWVKDASSSAEDSHSRKLGKEADKVRWKWKAIEEKWR